MGPHQASPPGAVSITAWLPSELVGRRTQFTSPQAHMVPQHHRSHHSPATPRTRDCQARTWPAAEPNNLPDCRRPRQWQHATRRRRDRSLQSSCSPPLLSMGQPPRLGSFCASRLCRPLCSTRLFLNGACATQRCAAQHRLVPQHGCPSSGLGAETGQYARLQVYACGRRSSPV